MTNKKSIFKSVAVVTAFSVATRLFAFLFKVFVSRQFGASVVGVYQMALSFIFRVGSCAQRTSDGDKPKDCRGRKNGRRERTVTYFDRACFVAVVGTSDTFDNISRRFPFAVGFADERVLLLVVIMLPALLSTSIYNVIRSWFWGKRSFLAFSFTEMLEEVLRITFTLIFSLGLIAAVTPLKGLAVGFLVSDIACAVVLFILFLIKKVNLAVLKTFRRC